MPKLIWFYWIKEFQAREVLYLEENAPEYSGRLAVLRYWRPGYLVPKENKAHFRDADCILWDLDTSELGRAAHCAWTLKLWGSSSQAWANSTRGPKLDRLQAIG
jgi:hypothetical protein